MKKINIILIVVILLIAAFLRFYKIVDVPPGLYIDEAAIAYNANSILTTGKDEHRVRYPLFFQSFGDYKTPGFIYLTSASIALFGKNDFAVRFPSALAGIATVLVFFLLLKKIVQIDKMKNRNFQYLPYLGAAILAISSWHIHFSRGGFEVTVAVFFYLLGCFLALVFWEKKQAKYLLAAVIAFGISTYMYHNYRVLAPFTFVLVTAFYFFTLPKLRKTIIKYLIIFLIIIFPITYFSFSSQGSARFVGTSIFSETPAASAIEKIKLYPMKYVKNYLSFFSYDFLFGNGDGNGRHQAVGMGLLFKWELPFLLIGLIWLFRQKRQTLKLITLGLLLLAPLVPSLAVPSPHTLRSLVLVIPLTMLVSCGLLIAYSYLKRLRFASVLLFILLVSYEFSLYAHTYYEHYPVVNALDWGGGYEETVKKAETYQTKFSHIVVDGNLQFAYIYFHFYTPSFNPEFVTLDWKKPKEWKEGSTLYIRPFYGNNDKKDVIDQVYLQGPNKTIFTQFWKL